MKTRSVILALAAAALASAGGCYERVVSAKGYGADQTVVHKPNVPTEGERINGYRKLQHKQMP